MSIMTSLTSCKEPTDKLVRGNSCICHDFPL